jgi:hypothetical protein
MFGSLILLQLCFADISSAPRACHYTEVILPRVQSTISISFSKSSACMELNQTIWVSTFKSDDVLPSNTCISTDKHLQRFAMIGRPGNRYELPKSCANLVMWARDQFISA